MCYVCNQRREYKSFVSTLRPSIYNSLQRNASLNQTTYWDNAALVFNTSSAVEIMQFEPAKEGITQNAISGYSTLYAIPDRWQFDRIRVTNPDSKYSMALR